MAVGRVRPVWQAPDSGRSGEAVAGPQRATREPRRVFISDYELIGSVGVYEHERRYQQRVVVSLDLEVLDRYDGSSDELGAVYDYDHAIAAIRDTVGSGHFNLLETLAERIAAVCLTAEPVQAVKVRIVKPDILIACRAVGIEIERRRG
jgi:dihydroneopterin aldolase